jgi:hypothetical protein
MSSPRDVDVRDWFAGQALAGLLAAEASRLHGDTAGTDQLGRRAADVAGRAWRIADAMLAARVPGPAGPAQGAAGADTPGLDDRIRGMVLQALREQDLIE